MSGDGKNLQPLGRTRKIRGNRRAEGAEAELRTSLFYFVELPKAPKFWDSFRDTGEGWGEGNEFSKFLKAKLSGQALPLHQSAALCAPLQDSILCQSRLAERALWAFSIFDQFLSKVWRVVQRWGRGFACG